MRCERKEALVWKRNLFELVEKVFSLGKPKMMWNAQTSSQPAVRMVRGAFACLRTPTTPLSCLRVRPCSRLATAAVVEMTDARKLRVLCLHSFRTSAQILKTQMEIAGWEASLGDLVEFTCEPDGHPASGSIPKDVAMFFPEDQYYEWWNASKGENGKTEYIGVEKTFEKVQETWESRGPFDGVLGFSQGATLTMVLAAKGAVEGWGPFGDAKRDNDVDAALTFAVCVSGMLARTQWATDLYAKSESKTPTLHIIGDADRVMPSGLSDRAASHFENATTARHAQGHVIPKLEGETLETVRAFFEAELSKRERTGEKVSSAL